MLLTRKQVVHDYHSFKIYLGKKKILLSKKTLLIFNKTQQKYEKKL